MQNRLTRLIVVVSGVRIVSISRISSANPLNSRFFHTTAEPKMASNQQKVLTYDNINPNVKTMEYAVRGPIVIRAVEIEKEISQVIVWSR